MKIVVDVPDEYYKALLSSSHVYLTMGGRGNGKTLVSTVLFAVANGTPLPKGHGDLKDVSKIHLDKFVNCKNYSLHPLHSEDFKRGYNSAIDDVWNVLREAPTIIEADKEAAKDADSN